MYYSERRQDCTLSGEKKSEKDRDDDLDLENLVLDPHPERTDDELIESLVPVKAPIPLTVFKPLQTYRGVEPEPEPTAEVEDTPDTFDDLDALGEEEEVPLGPAEQAVLDQLEDDKPAEDDTLDDDDLDTVAALDTRATIYKPTTTTRGTLNDDTLDKLRNWQRIHDERNAYWTDLFKAARIRINAAKIEARAQRRREKEAERKRASRSSPEALAQRRLSALRKMTAKPKGKLYPQLPGREEELVAFKQVMVDAIAKHGPKCSDAKIAAAYVAATGNPMDRNQAFRWGGIVEQLEAAGRPWHNLR